MIELHQRTSKILKSIKLMAEENAAGISYISFFIRTYLHYEYGARERETNIEQEKNME